MHFVEMDPELIRAALEGVEDELSPATVANEAFYRQFRCPRCGGAVAKHYDPRHAFADPNSPLPRALLRCRSCRGLQDPHTGIQVELGNLGERAGRVPVLRPER